VIEEEAEPSARAEHPTDLADGGVDLPDVLEDETGDHGVDGP
jgi:hypothetical protein